LTASRPISSDAAVELIDCKLNEKEKKPMP